MLLCAALQCSAARPTRLSSFVSVVFRGGYFDLFSQQNGQGMAADSVVAFKEQVDTLGLTDLYAKFQSNGWDTFMNFAFSTSDSTGKDPAVFEAEVIKVLLDDPAAEKALIPRIRRLFHQSYVVAATEMDAFAKPQGINEKVVMNPADRAQRTETLRNRINGFVFEEHNTPSTALIDRFATILIKGVVKFIDWVKCTSRAQEILEEPEIKGLRLNADGVLLQDIAPEQHCDLSGEFLWDYALRRRACAADIAGLMTYEAANLWTETLKAFFLRPPPAGYRKVGWPQLKAADQALWRYVGAKCEKGCKKLTGDTKTQFEKFWAEGMLDMEVRQSLCFLPASTSSSSASSGSSPATPAAPQSELAKLKNRLQNAEAALRNAKRKLDQPDGWHSKGSRKGNGKGGKTRRGGQGRAPNVPAEFGSLPTKMPNGEHICFDFHRPRGCPHATAGQRCFLGHHCCPRCHKGHAIADCSSPH